jgi:hypothetical protein
MQAKKTIAIVEHRRDGHRHVSLEDYTSGSDHTRSPTRTPSASAAA